MTKIQDQIALKGVETITITQFRMAPGEVITQVEMGRTFRITKLGRVVAVISKPELNAFELGAAARAVEREHRAQSVLEHRVASVAERTVPDPVLNEPTPVTPTSPPQPPKPHWATK